jgi:hypothetical protein
MVDGSLNSSRKTSSCALSQQPERPNRRWRRMQIGLLLAIFFSVQTSASPQTPQAGNTQRVSLNVLYRHFLAYQNHLDRVGAALDEKGENGSGFRDHFQKTLGFTNAEYAPVRAAAQRLEQELADEDAKIKAVIQAFRASYPKVLTSRSERPPLPPELAQLQKDRNAIIEGEMKRLNSDLGPDRAAKLQDVIEHDFAPNVRVQSVQPMGPRDLSKHPLPPFPPEVRP